MPGWVRNLGGFRGAREIVEFEFQKRRGLAGARTRAPCSAARLEYPETTLSFRK